MFFKDGVVDSNSYFNQEERPLFVLKEAYATNNTIDFNEANWLNGSYKGAINSRTFKTFKRIATWTSIIFDKEHIQPTYTWDDPIFRKIALMNIKKYDGKSESDNHNLEYHATNYCEKIIEQVKLIDPTIIICGYTRWLLDVALKNCGKPTIKEGEKKSQYTYVTESFNNKPITVIDFWHPSCRKTNEFLNTALSKSLKDGWGMNLHTEKGGCTPAEVGPEKQ